jgi:hypothetical protein
MRTRTRTRTRGRTRGRRTRGRTRGRRTRTRTRTRTRKRADRVPSKEPPDWTCTCRISIVQNDQTPSQNTHSKVKGNLCALELNVRVEALFAIRRQLVRQGCRRHQRCEQSQDTDKSKKRRHVVVMNATRRGSSSCGRSMWHLFFPLAAVTGTDPP